jgi:hypothetical protein
MSQVAATASEARLPSAQAPPAHPPNYCSGCLETFSLKTAVGACIKCTKLQGLAEGLTQYLDVQVTSGLFQFPIVSCSCLSCSHGLNVKCAEALGSTECHSRLALSRLAPAWPASKLRVAMKMEQMSVSALLCLDGLFMHPV